MHGMATNVTELVAHVHHKPLLPDLLAPSLSVPLKFPYQGGLYTWRGASSGTVRYQTNGETTFWIEKNPQKTAIPCCPCRFGNS